MFIIEVPYFNLDKTYGSQQVPRWIKLRESKYIIIHRNKALKIEQNKDKLILNCTEDEFFNIWFRYLDLKVDYEEENNKIRRLGKRFRVPMNRSKGIHLINQDDFEVYVLCKLIGFVGYNKAGKLMNQIATKYGIKHQQSMREAGKVIWYEWPKPKNLLAQLVLEDTEGNKVKTFLKKLCIAITKEGYIYRNSKNELFDLYFNHNLDVFPENNKIDKIIKKNYKCSKEEFIKKYLKESKSKGLIYVYILYHIMNPPE